MLRAQRLVLIGVLSLVVACGDDPVAPRSDAGSAAAPPVSLHEACTADPAEIRALLSQALSGPGLPSRSSALAKFDNVVRHVARGELPKAQDKVYTLVDFLLKHHARRTLQISEADLTRLINQLLCFVGLGDPVEDPDNTWVLNPNDPLTTLVTVDRLSGTQFPANAVSTPTVVTASQASPTALNTLLDKYAFVYDWSLTPSQPLNPGVKVTVGVCPSAAALANVPASELDDLLARLVLGHQHASSGFTPLARVPIPAQMALGCGDTQATATASMGRRLLDGLSAMLLPAVAHAAAARLAIGGVGGSTSEFSEFGPVDPLLKATGGVGGSTSEFIRFGPAGATSLVAALNGTIDGTVGTQTQGPGLPSVTVRTFQGTAIPGILVAFGTSAPATSTPVGNASVCGGDTMTDAAGTAAVSCIDFGTTVQYRIAYTKLSAVMTVPSALAGSDDFGNPVVTIDPAFQNWLVASYGPSTLVFTAPPAGRTNANENPYFTSEDIPARVEIRSDLGEVVPLAANQVTLTLPNGGEFIGGGSTRSTNAVAGVATFSVRLHPKTGARFGARAFLSDLGLVQAAPSNVFDVVEDDIE